MSALNLVVEQMFKLLVGHSLAGILYFNLNVVGFYPRLHIYTTAVIGKLTGIVGQSVQHKQSKHLVGLYNSVGRLYIKFNTFHLERLPALGQHIEQGLQLEALYMQAKLALLKLYPIGKYLVIFINLVEQLAYVLNALLAVVVAEAGNLMNHAIDERSDITYKRHLGTLLEILSLVLLNLQQLCGQLFTLLLVKVIGFLSLRLFLVEVIEQPQREEQQHNGQNNSYKHHVELSLLLLVLIGTCLKLAVLSGCLLQVEIHIAVLVAQLLIIDSCIGHTKLFAYRSNQIGSLVNNAVVECLLEIEEGRLIVAYLAEARCQRTIGT